MDIFSPLRSFADLITYDWLGLADNSYLGGAVNFWIYDLLKISILLVVINYFMAITRYYLPMERVRDLLTHKRWYGIQYLLAALLGVVTPFCSCSSIPLFIGFLSAGIPLGVTFAFLISSPLVNEASLFLFPSVFGLKITLIYNLVGITIAVLGGGMIQKLKLEKYIQPEILVFTGKRQLGQKYKGQTIPFKERLNLWTREMWEITKKIYPYIVIGVSLGALIHGFVPDAWVANTLSNQNWWTVPMAVLLGVPLYANSISVIPIIEALIHKGVAMGTALAFMTATVTLSIPEALMLKKILKWQLLAIFFAITTAGIIGMGYLFNAVSIDSLDQSNDESISITEAGLHPTQTMINSYFIEIALGTEYNFTNSKKRIRKWQQPVVLVQKNGEFNQYLNDCLDKIISDFNQFSPKTKLVINSSGEDVRFYLTDEANFSGIQPLSPEGYHGFFTFTWDNLDVIQEAIVLVDSSQNINDQMRCHIMREELTQAMGLGNDSERYQDSIFFIKDDEPFFYYTKIDEGVIKLLYSDLIKPGMSHADLEKTLQTE